MSLCPSLPTQTYLVTPLCISWALLARLLKPQGEITRERMKVPGCWLGIGGRTSCSLCPAGFCKRSWAAFHVGIKGQLFQVSKLCGSKFQAAFRLPKHFQVPAVSFDSFLPGDPRDMKQYETARFPMFWDYILQDESPANVCPGPVSAPPNPASLCNSCSEIRKAFDKTERSRNPEADWTLQRIAACLSKVRHWSQWLQSPT